MSTFSPDIFAISVLVSKFVIDFYSHSDSYPKGMEDCLAHRSCNNLNLCVSNYFDVIGEIQDCLTILVYRNLEKLHEDL